MPAHALELLRPIETQFARDVDLGLSQSGQKSLPSQYLYDELGSILFDAITVLPEYGLTRADARILRTNAARILAALPSDMAIAELGSGTGAKTRWILEAAARRSGSLVYSPIDISDTAVQQCCRVLEGIQGITIAPKTETYLEGLTEVVQRRAPKQTLMVLFLGSTIGNFDFLAARNFLRSIRELLRNGDALLLGTDLVKPLPQMLAAYDDPTGVTAAFNLNLLGRLNRELDANFDLRQFRHEARFDKDESRIEMHLVSQISQRVEIGATGQQYSFYKGETIWTEGSYKFRRSDITTLATQTGFQSIGQWTDLEWPFAETLLLAH